MHPSEFDPAYLPSAAPTPGGHIHVMGIAPLDGTDLCLPVDHHHSEAQGLRLTREQARHMIMALTHALTLSEPHQGQRRT